MKDKSLKANHQMRAKNIIASPLIRFRKKKKKKSKLILIGLMRNEKRKQSRSLNRLELQCVKMNKTFVRKKSD